MDTAISCVAIGLVRSKTDGQIFGRILEGFGKLFGRIGRYPSGYMLHVGMYPNLMKEA